MFGMLELITSTEERIVTTEEGRGVNISFSSSDFGRYLLKLVTPSHRSGVSPELKRKAVVSLPYPKKALVKALK